MPDNDYRLVRIIHPAIYRESGGQSGLAEVPDSSLSQHYRGGWTLLADDLPPGAVPAEPEVPRPVSLAEAAGPAEDSGGGDSAGGKAATRGRATGGRGAGQDQEQ